MPVSLTYPGVYIEELPSQVRTITGVGTSITAFIGRALKGPTDKPITIHSFEDYVRTFGGLWKKSNMSYAVYHYFLNGGMDAIIIRVYKAASGETDAAIFSKPGSSLKIKASNPGSWGRSITVFVDYNVDPEKLQADNTIFNIFVKEKTGNPAEPARTDAPVLETFLNVSVNSDSSRYISRVLEESSNLIRTGEITSNSRPADGEYLVEGTSGGEGSTLENGNIIPTAEVDIANKKGILALDNVDLFNMLCIPPYNEETSTPEDTTSVAIYDAALSYCEKKRAMLIVDPPSTWNNKSSPIDQSTGLDGTDPNNAFNLRRNANAAIYFPRIVVRDPLEEDRLGTFVPSGAIAGVIARTDSQRGIWKAPAGIEATLIGVSDLTVRLTDKENGDLNPVGVNCLRIMPAAGRIVWGARTMRGADRLADQWKYLPVRRLALYIEESLYRGTQWVVFEPNDEPLWLQIRLNIGAFMHDLFVKGAFQGSSPKEAYLVKCDHETTTQYDIDRGIVNIIVGFAPLKPAEFVILKIQQLAGQNKEA
jgi:uncharacterized protein